MTDTLIVARCGNKITLILRLPDRARRRCVDAAVKEVKAEKPAAKKITYGEKLELEKLNAEIPQLEQKKEELIASLGDAAADHEELAKRAEQLGELTKRIEILGDRWLELSEKAEG